MSYEGGYAKDTKLSLAKKKELFYARYKAKHKTGVGALDAWRKLHPYAKSGALFKRKTTYKKVTRKPKKKTATKAKPKKRKTTKKRVTKKGVKRVSCAADKAKVKKLEEQIIFNQQEISDLLNSIEQIKKANQIMINKLTK